MTDRASAEGLRAMRKVLMTDELVEALGASRVDWGEPDHDGFYTPTVYRDTGSRPDSGGDIDALLAEADRRVTALQYDVKNARMRQGIGMGADIYRDVIARLSAPRTETSVDWTEGHGTVARPRTETSDTVRIGSKTYLAGADDD